MFFLRRERRGRRRALLATSSRRLRRTMRPAPPIAAGSPKCAAPAPSRRPAISPPMRPIGTSFAPCISARSGSRPPSPSSIGTGADSTPCSISAPAPAGCSNSSRRAPTRAVGIDQSPQMLALARARLEKAGLRNVQLRQGDIYALPVEHDSYDLVIIHQVLHYLDDPARAVREAARALRPSGRLLIVDFAPHEEESLRSAACASPARLFRRGDRRPHRRSRPRRDRPARSRARARRTAAS